MKNQKDWAPFLQRTLLFSIALLGLSYLYTYSRPIIQENYYVIGRDADSIGDPDSSAGPYFAKSFIYINSIHPSKFYLEADDCLDSFIINNKPVLDIRYPICNWPFGTIIDLRNYLEPGSNTVEYYLRNRHGDVGVKLVPWIFDPLGIAIMLAVLLSLFWYCLEHRSLRKVTKNAVRRVQTKCRDPSAYSKFCKMGILALGIFFVVYLPIKSFQPIQGMFSFAYEDEQTYVTPPPLNHYDTTAPQEQRYILETEWNMRRTHFTRYYFTVDDCLEKLWVNGKEVENDVFPLCPFPYGDTINLSAYLRSGNNTLKMEIYNESGATTLTTRPSLADPLFFPYFIAVAGFLIVLVWSKRSVFTNIKRCEHVLLFTFIAARFWTFFAHLRLNEGWDWGYHMAVLDEGLFTFSDFLTRDVFQSFYSYHPPLGFVLSDPFLRAGVGLLLSAKVVAFIASFVVFFTLRELLSHLRLLHKPVGLIFLYGGMSVPLMLFMSRSVNLDILILMFTCMALYLSVVLFGVPDLSASNRKTHMRKLFLSLTIFLALMTKFNGLLIASIPVIVACVFQVRTLLQKNPNAFRIIRNAFALSVIGVVLALPYYHWRYFLTEGTYFPHNGQFYEDRLNEGQAIKAEDPQAYFFELFKGADARKEKPYWRDSDIQRLSDSWNDFWIRDFGLGLQSRLSLKISVFYQNVMPVLLLLSALLLLIQMALKRTYDPSWVALGISLFFYSIIQYVLLLYYIWKNACTWCYASKGIYIAPVILSIAFLLANIATVATLLPRSWQKKHLCNWILVSLLITITIVHHVIPVY